VKDGPTSQGRRSSSPAVEQATQILFCLAGSAAPQMSLADICSQVGVSGSKAFGILEALSNAGLVRRGERGKGYALGTGLVALSRKVLDDLVPSQLAEPVLEDLTQETGSTSVLGLITGESAYVAAKKEAEGTIRVVMRVGHILPLTYGAHGKAVVAVLPEAQQDGILKDEDVYFYGNPGKLNRTRLQKELALAAKNGFACDFGEAAEGVNVVAAPVFGSGGTPVGFVEIFVLASPERAVQLGPVVARAGKALSRRLGAPMD
jgi:DNA-binding IclR family transcriptional regulator